MFYCSCFFSFFHGEISEFPRPIAVKLCHVIGSMFGIYNLRPKFWGTLPEKKIWRLKTCKIRGDSGQPQTSIANIFETDGDA